MLTAWATPEARAHGLKLGAKDYITKPFRPQELVERVRELLVANGAEFTPPTAAVLTSQGGWPNTAAARRRER
jgi:DNA-binding response OmpR family regulator